MTYLGYAFDAVFVALAAAALVVFLRSRLSSWSLPAAGVVLAVTIAAWAYSPDISSLARLSVPIVAFWILGDQQLRGETSNWLIFQRKNLARPEGLEPSTPGLEGRVHI